MADTPTLPEGGEPTPSGAQPEPVPPNAPEPTPAAAIPAEPIPVPEAPPSATPIPTSTTAPSPAAQPTPAATDVAGTAAVAANAAAATTTGAAATPAAGSQPQPAAAAPSAEETARQAANEITTRGRTFWNQLDPATRRPTIILGAILLIAVLGSQFLNALIPAPAGANTGRGGGGGGGSGTNTIQLGGGARITPPEGWTVVGPTANLQGVELQKGSVIVDVMVAAFSGTPQDLLQTYVGRYLDVSASQLTVGDISVGPGPNGHLTATAFYVGIFFEVGTLQGVVATQVWGNVGVVVDAAAPQGQLQGSLDDIETIIGTIEVR